MKVLLLSYSRDAVKFLIELEAKQHRQINNKILLLIQDPLPNDSAELRGFSGLYRVDSGEFRIVYKFDAKVLYVILIGRRNDDQIYKQLTRK